MQDMQVAAPGAGEVDGFGAVRRRRTGKFGRRFQVVSAAAVVAVVIAGVGVLDQGGGRAGVNRPITAAQLGDPEVEAQFAAVQAWYDAFEYSDVDKAWDALGPISRAGLQRKSELDKMFEFRRTANLAYADYAPQQAWESFSIPGDPEGAVVTTPGRSEGEDASFTQAMPVVRDHGRWLVEFGMFSRGVDVDGTTRSAHIPGEPTDTPIEVSSDARGELFGRIDGQGMFTRLEHRGNGLFRYDHKYSDLPSGDHYLETVHRGPGWFFVQGVDLSGNQETTTTTAIG
jgi:hypothetical protein